MTRGFLVRLQRALRGLLRPSAATNARRLASRGEDPAAFIIRDATSDDIPALAMLHAKTWAQTYPMVLSPPTPALREMQWRKTFATSDGTWFCLLVVTPDGRVIGFAKGERFVEPTLPSYHGQLSKIYLLSDYQRLGLGRRLMAVVASRFEAMGITSMVLFADAGNPTCAFYEALGGHNLPNADGTVNHGNYGWHDIRPLAAL